MSMRRRDEPGKRRRLAETLATSRKKTAVIIADLASVAARVVASPATITAATRFTGTAIARGHVQRTVSDIASIAEARAFVCAA